MDPASGLRRLLGRLRSSEEGIALPTAMLATVAALALGGAAVMSSVSVQQGSHRDTGSKGAIGAADAGANVALMRLARESQDLATAPCLDGATPSGGWCPPVTGEVGDATYSYRISEAGVENTCGGFDLCVVATGIADEVTRRVLISFNQGSGGPVGGGSEEEEEGEGGGGGGGPEGLIGVEDVEIDNNADARVNVGTNGNIYVHNNGNVCGNIRHGIGKEAKFENNGTQCDGFEVTSGNITVPPVSSFIPSNIATVNSNYRLALCASTNNPSGCQTDGYTGKWSSTEPWNPSTRTISTSNNQTITLGGGDYFICRLLLNNNSHLVMKAGTQVRLFFDTPENCKLASGSKQIDVQNNANITATGYQAESGNFEMPGLFLMGSTSLETRVEWSNNSGTNELVLYAPNSVVDLQNNAEFIGMIVGKKVHLHNNAIISQDDGFVLPPELNPWHEDPVEEEEPEEEDGVVVFTPQYYVECTGPPTPTPSAGC
jgi:hypothetical protein